MGIFGQIWSNFRLLFVTQFNSNYVHNKEFSRQMIPFWSNFSAMGLVLHSRKRSFSVCNASCSPSVPITFQGHSPGLYCSLKLLSNPLFAKPKFPVQMISRQFDSLILKCHHDQWKSWQCNEYFLKTGRYLQLWWAVYRWEQLLRVPRFIHYSSMHWSCHLVVSTGHAVYLSNTTRYVESSECNSCRPSTRLKHASHPRSQPTDHPHQRSKLGKLLHTVRFAYYEQNFVCLIN